jgi:WD40 repeat protein
VDKTIRIWDLKTNKPARVFPEQLEPVSNVEVSPDGQHCASATKEAFIRVWDINTGLSRTFSDEQDNSGIRFLAYNRDGTLLAGGSDDGRIRIFDASNGKILARFLGHAQKIQGLAFSPDGTLLASSSDDSTIKLWQTTDWSFVRELDGHKSGVYQISFNPDGRFLISTSDDKTARLWSVDTGKEVVEPIKHDGPVWTADFSPNGQLLATGGEDSLVRFWSMSVSNNIPTLHKSTVLQISDGPVWSIAFNKSSDGLLLAIGGQDRLIRVVNLTKFGELLSRPDELEREAEQRGGVIVGVEGNEPTIIPIPRDRFVANQ